ncbi:MAG: pentapeptide repeat-containing protein [Crocosphaera sp.]|jgi:uncharacterized protein YjbI with pentapeptide repeats
MFQSQEAIDCFQRYENGHRDFRNFQLRRADLRGINLSNTDFRGVDLSYTNLRDVNFSGADLRDVYFNEADLTGANFSGANLEGASLIKVYLIKANCYRTNLTGAYLTGAYLTKTNFKEAKFNGAYLNRANLSAAELKDAYYDEKTRFDSSFNPQNSQMRIIALKKKVIQQSHKIAGIKEQKITQTIPIEKILKIFNHLTEISSRYLGKAITKKYWNSSKPSFEWLDNFEINSSAEITFKGGIETVLTPSKLQLLQAWVTTFIKGCSQIVQNYHKMIDSELINSLISVESPQNSPPDNSLARDKHSRSIKSQYLELLSV